MSIMQRKKQNTCMGDVVDLCAIKKMIYILEYYFKNLDFNVASTDIL